MSTINRRTFLHISAAALGSSAFLNNSSAYEAPQRKFTMNLNIGQVGVRANPFEAIALAKKYGYESITPMT
ncbi:MAG: hypothetical protein IID32_11055, partial [Planctomycetes bacterium]|nr:hypothetical protein [Planctomycetota bacterium]